MRTWRWLVLAVLATATACGGGKDTTSPPPAPVLTPAVALDATIRSYFEVHGGRRLWLECAGSGSPTVILEGGLGSGTLPWAGTAELLSTETRVCRYDRAGVVASDQLPAGSSPSAMDQVEDLTRLLANAGVEPPFIVGGWSYGGIVARAFAVRHPDEVVGVLLVESSDERQFREPVFADFGPAREGGRDIDIDRSIAELNGADLADTPLVVVTSGWGTTGPPEFWEIWRGYQDAFPTLSSRSRHLVATRDEHDVPITNPALMAEALSILLRAARADAGPEPCGPALDALGARCVEGSLATDPGPLWTA